MRLIMILFVADCYLYSKVDVMVFCNIENYVPGMSFTGIPHKPSFLPNTNSCLYSHYKSYQFACIGIRAFKRPSLDFTVSPKDVLLCHVL